MWLSPIPLLMVLLSNKEHPFRKPSTITEVGDFHLTLRQPVDDFFFPPQPQVARSLPCRQNTITACSYSCWQWSHAKKLTGWLYQNWLQYNQPAHRWIQFRPVLAEPAEIWSIYSRLYTGLVLRVVSRQIEWWGSTGRVSTSSRGGRLTSKVHVDFKDHFKGLNHEKSLTHAKIL